MGQSNTLNRRRMLSGAAGLAAGGALAGWRLPALTAAQDAVSIRWWDQFLPLESLHQSIWDQYQADHPEVTVEHTVYNPQEMGQALQLAYESGQMPDVHSLAGVGLPTRALLDVGWFQPLPNGEEIRAALPEGSLLEGITVFDGQVYSFPLFSFRQYESLLWYNKDLIAQAGLDPELGPRSWDEFRQAAATITEAGGGIFGWIQGLNFAERLGNHVTDLARAAGAHGPVDFLTGEYAYATDPFVQAVELLFSLSQDGTLFPASSTLDARTARARWATGVAGMFFDGPWNVGVITTELTEFIDRVGVAPVPGPEGVANLIHVSPGGSTPGGAGAGGGPFWISSQSPNAAVAADILRQLTTPEYYVGLAERMDQPPLDLTAVEGAEVHPTYRQAVGFFQEGVRLAPSPVVANPAVSLVFAEMADIRPNLGEIVQGIFSGNVTDIRGTLQTLGDQLSAERERAIGVVQGEGHDVSLDDWLFPNWVAGEDYTGES